MLQDEIIVRGLFPATTLENVRGCRGKLVLWKARRVMRGILKDGAPCGHVPHRDSGVAKTKPLRACMSAPPEILGTLVTLPHSHPTGMCSVLIDRS